jgi:transposase
MTITSTQKFNKEVTQQQYYIGLDVHANQWSVCVRFQKMELKIFTCEPNPSKFASTIRNLFPESQYNCVYEAGFSGYSIHRKLTELGLKCSVVHPLDIPTTNKEKLNKSDKVDCRKLAREFENGTLRPLFIPSEDIEGLRMLSHRRIGLTKDRSRIKNQIKGSLHYVGVVNFEKEDAKYWKKSFINFLEKLEHPVTMKSLVFSLKHKEEELKLLERVIIDFINNHDLKILFSLIQSVPGVGFLSAICIIAELGDIHRFSNINQLNSYVGLIPMIQSSDQKQRGNVIHIRHNRICLGCS